MNDIMRFIHGKRFLETLFPMGLIEPVVIGQICLNVFGNTIIGLHTKQQPVGEVAKWGVWGKDYNVVVIKLLGGDDTVLEARNWPSKNYLPLDLFIESDRCKLVQSDGDKEISIEFSELIFQKCEKYLDG